jgi:hypothetical protein
MEVELVLGSLNKEAVDTVEKLIWKWRPVRS